MTGQKQYLGAMNNLSPRHAGTNKDNQAAKWAMQYRELQEATLTWVAVSVEIAHRARGWCGLGCPRVRVSSRALVTPPVK
jgi:hypothetical protein